MNCSQEEILLAPDQCEAFVQCLKKLAKNEDVEKVMAMVNKVQPLTQGYDISKMSPLFLPNGEVKDWMMTSVQNGKENGLAVWGGLVRILGRSLHLPGDGTVLLNSLLHVVEKAFKHNSNAIRIAAYKAWMVLMDNFALNHTVLVTRRRIKLIIRPLLVSPI